MHRHAATRYLKEQLRAQTALHAISDDAAFALVEALCLLPQLERHAPGVGGGRFDFDALDFAELSRGKKPKQRLAGPWAAGSDLNEWAAAMFEELQREPHKWREQIEHIASRLPAAALPVLTRTMAFIAAFDPRPFRRSRRAFRDIGNARLMLDLLAEMLGGDLGHVAAWIEEGVAARSRSFDFWWARQDEYLRWSFRVADGSGTEAFAQAWNQWKAAMADSTVFIELDDVASGDLAPSEAGWLVLSLDEEALELRFDRYSSIESDALLSAGLDALDGRSFVRYAQDELSAEEWAHWQAVEHSSMSPVASFSLRGGEYVTGRDAEQVCRAPLRGCTVLHLLPG